MIYTTTVIQQEDQATGLPTITRIDVDFSDEDVNLQGSVRVKGSWKQYLKSFERDMRNNNRSLFPVPEPEPIDEEMI